MRTTIFALMLVACGGSREFAAYDSDVGGASSDVEPMAIAGASSSPLATGGAVATGGASAVTTTSRPATGGAAPRTTETIQSVATGGMLATGGSPATGGVSAATGGVTVATTQATGGIGTGGATVFATGGAPTAQCTHVASMVGLDICSEYNDPSNPSKCLRRVPDAVTSCQYNATKACSPTATQFDSACYVACVACSENSQSQACKAAMSAANNATGFVAGGCKWKA